MKIGWLADDAGYIGGAELTQAEFRKTAPNGAEIVDCPVGHVVPGLDRYVVHNCVTYALGDLLAASDKPIVKYWHDVAPHVEDGLRAWLYGNTTNVFCSPLQRTRFLTIGEFLDDQERPYQLIPPPVDLDRFRKAREGAQERAGAVAVGPWMNPGKAPHLAAEWAAGNGGIDFYGGGPFAPPGSRQVSYDEIPKILAAHKTFIHLPTAIEPFGRSLVEAWAAGCRLVTNELVGSRYWITKEPDKLETAAEDFWDLVLA